MVPFRPRILILEDEISIQKVIGRTLETALYQYDSAFCAEDARRLCQTTTYDLALCDIGLPGESGISFIHWLTRVYPETMVIMVTGCDDMSVAEQTLNHGAYSYVVKPFSGRTLLINIVGALNERQRHLKCRQQTNQLQEEVSLQAMELAETNARLKRTMNGVIKAMAAALESRDPYTVGHQQRVAELSIAIGKRLCLDENRLEALYIAAMVHDIGKISIPAQILSKPGKLSPIEFGLIQTHAETGFRIMKEIDFPWPVADIVHQHHERIDGSGYPQGLKESELMLESKILTVADVVEAMASHRPYRPALGIQLALAEITANRNRYYAADVVHACLEVFANNSEHQFAFPGGVCFKASESRNDLFIQ
ncbi:MAG: HD domain-containing phosphohydrolase [Thermodesulfobacteriota bacterium]